MLTHKKYNKNEAELTPKIGYMFCVIVSINIFPGISQGTPFNKRYLLISLTNNSDEIINILKNLLCISIFCKSLFIRIRGQVNTKANIIINSTKINIDNANVVSP